MIFPPSQGGICDPSLRNTLSYCDLDRSGFFPLKLESRSMMGHWHVVDGWFVPSGWSLNYVVWKKCYCRRSDFCFTFAKSMQVDGVRTSQLPCLLENPPLHHWCNKLANFQSLPCNDQLGKVGCIHWEGTYFPRTTDQAVETFRYLRNHGKYMQIQYIHTTLSNCSIYVSSSIFLLVKKHHFWQNTNLNNLFVWKIQVVTPHRGFPGGGSPWASECLGSHGHKYLSTLLSSKGTASHSWVGKGYCRIFRPGISPTEVMAERERFVNLQEQ